MEAGVRPSRYALLLVLSALWAAATIKVRYPKEDAAMLLRYSGHIAQGYGVVWNIGGPHVDGATDFLFLVCTACLNHFGVPLERAAEGIGVVSWTALILLVYDIMVRRLRTDGFAALLLSLFVLAGPGTKYVECCFGTTFFVFWSVAMLWCLYAYRRSARRSWAWDALLGTAWLLLGLSRPEGVILGAFLLLGFSRSVENDWGRRALVGTLARAGAVMLALGGAYFVWHWRTFGYLLPNPYYQKGGFRLHFGAVAWSAFGFVVLSGPMALAAAASAFPAALPEACGLSGKPDRMLLPAIVGFTAIWVLLSGEMNYLYRFQYVLLPMAALQSAALLAVLPKKCARAFLGSLLAYGALNGAYFLTLAQDNGGILAEVGQRLARFSPSHKMAVSEAGLLPFYSGWRALDTWGLNDPVIAHRGTLTEEDLERFDPDLILVHRSPQGMGNGVRGRMWYRMASTIFAFERAKGYVYINPLDKAFGREAKDFDFYVKGGLDDFDGIKKAIIGDPGREKTGQGPAIPPPFAPIKRAFDWAYSGPT